MPFKQYLPHVQGLITISALLVFSLWLGVTHQLDLYINPAYLWFTMIMAVGGLAAVTVSWWRRLPPESTSQPSRAMLFVNTALCMAAILAALFTMPHTLTNAAVGQRGLNASGLDFTTTQLPVRSLFDNQNQYQHFSVKEWASLLAQTNDSSFFQGKNANMIGFVSPGHGDIFYVSRFVITCCAVDAQPIGVPVYAPGWQAHFKVDSWISVSGQFADTGGMISLQPKTINQVSQPADPYVH